ncbi:hypothetical protein [Cellulosimicrobium marinum]|uniref:hypothetical protein n=1 Tax=Cellulosimicrobium marinum TaxID=1638992 RepID=UPI001E2AA431|nr:hypothetical protein [Cellulosimicrobium marinum]MCB7136877.1 hypothetical protein [Cellulosimicrobium marinum]
MDNFLPALGALVPSVGVGLLFWVAMRYIVRADRNERTALARLDAEENATRGAEGASVPRSSGVPGTPR